MRKIGRLRTLVATVAVGASAALTGGPALAGPPPRVIPTPGDPGPVATIAGAPVQRAELAAGDGHRSDQFGYSVAISGSTAIVGAPFRDLGTGAAYIFTWTGTSWAQQAEITAADGGQDDYFGYSVAISGKTAVVGAWGKDTAYVFTQSSSGWAQQAELTDAGSGQNDLFGYSVAVSGPTIVVGAYRHDAFTGTAYVFGRSGRSWSQQAQLSAADGSTADEFGYSVAISGTTAVVGASGNDSATGAAYVFTRAGTAWSQQAKLTAADGAPGDDLGSSVAIAGSVVAAGAPQRTQSSGSVYVFARTGTAWSQQAELTAGSGAAGGLLGDSVAATATAVLAGAPFASTGTGTAYLFGLTQTGWHQDARLTASDGASDDYFGSSVAIETGRSLIGADGNEQHTGAAYVFARQ